MRKFTYNDMLDYLIVIITIIISGAVIYQYYNKELLIISFILFFIVHILKNKGIKLDNKNLKFMFLLIMVILINYAFNMYNEEIYKYFRYIISFSMVLLIINTVEFESFEKKYCVIVCWLSLASLILYIIVLVNPNFAYKFSIIEDFAGSKFSNAFLYAYMIPIGENYRNNSIFWEAGAFQAIVNLALFFNLFISKDKSKIKNIIYILTIITTGSTIGYILLLANIGMYILKNNKLKLFKYYMFVFFICIFMTSSFSNVIFDKFESDNLSFNRRTGDIVVDLSIASESIGNILIGSGQSNYLNEFPKILYSIYGMKGSSSSNGISATIAQFGMIFTFIITYYYFGNMKYIFKYRIQRIVIICAFFIVFSTENYMFSPLFLTIAAYKNIFNRRLQMEAKNEGRYS